MRGRLDLNPPLKRWAILSPSQPGRETAHPIKLASSGPDGASFDLGKTPSRKRLCQGWRSFDYDDSGASDRRQDEGAENACSG